MRRPGRAPEGRRRPTAHAREDPRSQEFTTMKNDVSKSGTASRAVERLVRGVATSDGAGVRLTRVLTQDLQRRLDPFLMLDAFRNENPDDYIGGFPDHPHRGFETVTYMIAGRMRHRDSAGNEGLLGPGGAQWMTAGSGLIHSELPEQEAGLMEGFQLWLNLPAARKMVAPSYRDIPPAAIPEFEAAGGVRVRAIAGESHGVAGAVSRPDTEPLFLDVHLPAGARFAQALPAGHNAFTYTYRGSARVAGTEVPDRHMAILANDGRESVEIEAIGDARVLVVAGRPLNEPIAQYGPFVMNTADQIRQTLVDYQRGAFEAAVVRSL
jgi:redox-sensitive bicupin YhaK (pirin superfamily)